MLDQQFRLHCQKRHPGLGFWDLKGHAGDHEARRDQLDHIHDNQREPEGPEAGEDGDTI